MKVKICKEEVKLEKKDQRRYRAEQHKVVAICKLDKRGHQRCPEAKAVCGARHGDRGKVIVLANKGKVDLTRL